MGSDASAIECPKCKALSPRGMAFCGECGASLQIQCPKCTESIPWNIKFCPHCGINVIEAKEKIARYKEKRAEDIRERKRAIREEEQREKQRIDAIKREFAETGDLGVRFSKDSRGIITDRIKQSQWIVGPDEPTSYNDAYNWAYKLEMEGGGWAMPKAEELNELKTIGISTDNWGPFENSGNWIWRKMTMAERLFGGTMGNKLRVYFGTSPKPSFFKFIKSYETDSRAFAFRYPEDIGSER